MSSTPPVVGVCGGSPSLSFLAVRTYRLIAAAALKLPREPVNNYNHSLLRYEEEMGLWNEDKSKPKPTKPAILKMDLSPVTDELIALGDALRPMIPGTRQRSGRSVRTKVEVRQRIESEMGFNLEHLKKLAYEKATERFMRELKQKSDAAKKAFQNMIIALVPQAEAEQERRKREHKSFTFTLGDLHRKCFVRAMEAHELLIQEDAATKKKRSESWEAEQRGKCVQPCTAAFFILTPVFSWSLCFPSFAGCVA